MEEIRIIKYTKNADKLNDVFVYGFAHDWQTLIAAVEKVQLQSPFPVKITQFGDIFVISTNFVEKKRGNNDNK